MAEVEIPRFEFGKNWAQFVKKNYSDERLGIAKVLAKVQKGRRFGFSIERALLAMAKQRLDDQEPKLVEADKKEKPGRP